MPKSNKSAATVGHNRTLVGFYAVKPSRGSTAPRRLRFEIVIESPSQSPETTVITADAPSDGKIRLIPIPISLPILPATIPGEYKATWTVVDETSGDWDADSANFTKANVEKIADVDTRQMPTPPPPVRPSDGFATKPSTPPPVKSSTFEAGTPRKSKGSAHEGFLLDTPTSNPKDNSGFEQSAKPKKQRVKQKDGKPARQ
jgi:hypothetical protein